MSHEYEQSFDTVVVQYFSGQLAESARSAFEAWVQEDSSRMARVERLRVIWEISAEASAGPDAEAALARVKDRIRDRQAAATAIRPMIQLEPSLAAQRSWASSAWRIAAVIVVLAGAGLLWRSMGSRIPPATHVPAVRSYATARGERAVITLPDGSVVTLHNESTLEVPVNFSTRMRDVRLRGEGYFDVTSDSSRRFMVYSGGAVVQVLGTRFGVRARDEDRAVQVAVVDGRVRVGFKVDDTAASVLTAGQVARLQDDSVAVRGGIDVRRLLSWTDGRLIFDETPVPEVLAELSRWFDRDFAMGDSALASLRLTTTLSGRSLAEAIAVLESALDVRVAVEARRIILRPFAASSLEAPKPPIAQ